MATAATATAGPAIQTRGSDFQLLLAYGALVATAVALMLVVQLGRKRDAAALIGVAWLLVAAWFGVMAA